jgi:hypothetical protein
MIALHALFEQFLTERHYRWNVSANRRPPPSKPLGSPSWSAVQRRTQSASAFGCVPPAQRRGRRKGDAAQ